MAGVAERDNIARSASAEGEPMFGRVHSRKRAGAAVRIEQGKGCGRRLFPEGAPELHGVARHCALMKRLPSPPLTAGSFPATILTRAWPPIMIPHGRVCVYFVSSSRSSIARATCRRLCCGTPCSRLTQGAHDEGVLLSESDSKLKPHVRAAVSEA